MSSINCGKVVKKNNQTYEWCIPRFQSRCYKFGEYISSPTFSTMVVNNELFWQLKIYPHGHHEKEKGFISIYLESINDFAVNVLYELNIKDVTNFNDKTECIFKPNSSIYGYTNCAERSDVIKKVNQLNRVFTVTCEFFNITLIKNSCDSQMDGSKIKILNDIGQLFENKNFYDVIIKTKTKEFKAHKVILSARSQVFADMLNNDKTEKVKSVVEIKDVDWKILEVMLKFIYTGEATITEKMTKELLISAHKYALNELRNICITKLYNSLNVDNALDLLSFANLHNFNKFKKRIVDFIVANANYITRNPEFDSFKNIPDIPIELFGKLTLDKKVNRVSS